MTTHNTPPQLTVRRVNAYAPGVFSEEEIVHLMEATALAPSGCVLCIVDAWDHHRLPGFFARMERNLEGFLLPLIAACRRGGIQICHLPSDRKIHPSIAVADEDWLIDWSRFPKSDGNELQRRCAEAGISKLLYAGYASNRCILNKPAGAPSMARQFGMRDPILVRDASLALETAETIAGEWCHVAACMEFEWRFGGTATVADVERWLAA